MKPKLVEEKPDHVVIIDLAGRRVSVGIHPTGWWAEDEDKNISHSAIECGADRSDIEKALGITENDREVNLALDRLVARQRRKLQCL